mmetsp:Transcript_8428/g.21607  ORF Transcript_8428/g.21607 Transcript_8428/m.21607 type:complete len:238 (+) Transcript_8428:755-1468(+)
MLQVLMHREQLAPQVLRRFQILKVPREERQTARHAFGVGAWCRRGLVLVEDYLVNGINYKRSRNLPHEDRLQLEALRVFDNAGRQCHRDGVRPARARLQHFEGGWARRAAGATASKIALYLGLFALTAAFVFALALAPATINASFAAAFNAPRTLTPPHQNGFHLCGRIQRPNLLLQHSLPFFFPLSGGSLTGASFRTGDAHVRKEKRNKTRRQQFQPAIPRRKPEISDTMSKAAAI